MGRETGMGVHGAGEVCYLRLSCVCLVQMFIEELLEVMGDYLGPSLDYGAWNHCLHVITAGIK